MIDLIVAMARGTKLTAPQAQAGKSHWVKRLVPARGTGNGRDTSNALPSKAAADYCVP